MCVSEAVLQQKQVVVRFGPSTTSSTMWWTNSLCTSANEDLGTLAECDPVTNRVVFDTSGSYIENKMTKNVLGLWERDGVYVVDMLVAPPGREQMSKPPFWRRGM